MKESKEKKIRSCFRYRSEIMMCDKIWSVQSYKIEMESPFILGNSVSTVELNTPKTSLAGPKPMQLVWRPQVWILGKFYLTPQSKPK